MAQLRALGTGLALLVILWAARKLVIAHPSGLPPLTPTDPPVDAGADLRTSTGRAVTLDARFGDRDPQRWVLTWGDGERDSGVVPASGRVRVRHRYQHPGHYALRLTGYPKGPSAPASSDTLSAVVEPTGTPEVMIGAGDIGECQSPFPAQTAAIISRTPGTVFTLGDNAYPNGRPEEFAQCYAPSWGAFKKRTLPLPGNHEYSEYPKDTTATGYFSYFGVAAHDAPTGWYSYDLGAWHIIVLNSNLKETPMLARVFDRDAQQRWLKADLAAHPAKCTLAMWHSPRFSSGIEHGSDTLVAPFWEALYAAGADVVLNGHEHHYERFAPQTPDGARDPVRGIREFVVGTGGAELNPFGHRLANSEDTARVHGVLKLTLYPTKYHWQFIPTPDNTHTDSGTTACH